jgi:hypothetical protein
MATKEDPLHLICALCQQKLDALHSFFRASGEFLPAKDALQRFSNAPLHWKCYATWPERPRFARCYVDAWVKANRRNPFWWTVLRDEHVYLSVNPQPPVEQASLRLTEVGNDIRVPLSRWSEWLRDVDAVTPGLHELEKTTLAAVLPTLRARFPDDHAIVQAIDPDEKKPRN